MNNLTPARYLVASVDDKAQKLHAFHLRRLMRIAFYASVGRRPPVSLRAMPSYIRSVQRHFKLDSRNKARAMLAEVEGYESWAELAKDLLNEE